MTILEWKIEKVGSKERKVMARQRQTGCECESWGRLEKKVSSTLIVLPFSS